MMSATESPTTFFSLLDVRKRAAPRRWGTYTAAVVAKLRQFAPYAAIELVMPGGSLMALGLWLYRRQKNA